MSVPRSLVGATLLLALAGIAAAQGALVVRATDHEGPAEGTVHVEILKETSGRWSPVTNAVLSAGIAAFTLEPGTYRVRVRYRGAKPEPESVVEGIAIEVGSTEGREFYFEKATLVVSAKDHDGLAKGIVEVDLKDAAGAGWKQVVHGFLKEGPVSFSLVPGTYRVRVRYKEAKPEVERISDEIVLADAGAESRELKFEKGALLVTATDSDGAAEGTATVEMEDARSRRWRGVESARLKGGHARFGLIPGTYRLRVKYSEAKPSAERIFEDVTVSDGVEEKREIVFEKGSLRLTARDCDGWAEGIAYVDRRDEDRDRWTEVVKAGLRDGTASFPLIPGTYRARVYYEEAEPEPTTVEEGIEIVDRAREHREFYFEKGMLRVVAVDAQGGARGGAYIERRSASGTGWERVTSYSVAAGHASFTLVPGTYRVRVVSRRTKPDITRIHEGIVLRDCQSLTLADSFGGGVLPPVILALGPVEVGDGDGRFEVGERALFRFAIVGGDVDQITFLRDREQLLKTHTPGRFEIMIPLLSKCEHRVQITVRHRGTFYEKWAAAFRVSEPGLHPPGGARALPADYGGGATDHPTVLRSEAEPPAGLTDTARRLALDWLDPFTGRSRAELELREIKDGE